MSTNSGHIVIEPPLNWAEIRKATEAIQAKVKKSGYGSKYSKDEIAAAAPEALAAKMNFGLRVTESVRQTDEGPLSVRVSAEVSFYSRDGSAVCMGEGEILKAIMEAAPGHSYNGVLYCLNEDSETGSKAVVKDGKISGITGKTWVKWADGSETLLTDI